MFKDWCKNETATFESNDGEDFNVQWSELSFYSDLVKKVEEVIDLAKS